MLESSQLGSLPLHGTLLARVGRSPADAWGGGGKGTQAEGRGQRWLGDVNVQRAGAEGVEARRGVAKLGFAWEVRRVHGARVRL